ncbi:MAG: acetyltransferase [Cycloclasticus sp. symbiont of Poecilosclerida sp. M]|nr:MAG: acetyltransferase [Cycloclasticus sp. symbiont of Poecilosclerida sp. M]
MQIDVFNGDADGICALIQLRLVKPMLAELVTGVKRDTQLLNRVTATAGDSVTVLDVSLAKNREGLEKVLSAGASVLYIDHHQAGDIPEHKNLEALINTDANVCTSLLVDQFVEGRFREWAIVAAFGDNMTMSAERVCKEVGLSNEQADSLKELGICVNYNAYGGSLEDLHFSPEQLYREMCGYDSPFKFMLENASIYTKLEKGYAADMSKALDLKAEHASNAIAVYMLPDACWSRRVSGVFSNDLANENPERAHAVLSTNEDGSLTVSVRAPLSNKSGADDLCQSFPTGGGRKAAAGISQLPLSEFGHFVEKFSEQYTGS